MDRSHNLLVKFKPESIYQVKEGKIYFIDPEKIIRTADFIFSLHYDHVIPELAETGEIICTENNIDFSNYKGLVYIKNAADMPLDELEHLAAKFRELDIVEYAEIEPVEPPPPPEMDNPPFLSTAVSTPDFSGRQTYLQGHMGGNISGIDAQYAWSIGVTGRGVRCADIEWGFIYDHEDLRDPNFIELIRTTNHDHDDHGTAVVGVIFARNNRFGMLGANHELDRFYGVSEITRGRVGGIAEGLRHLRAGDVFIYEMQTGGREGRLVPPDFYRGIWDITKQATDNGIIVVCTAGNGDSGQLGENLDHAFYNEYRGRGDNGIIMVGAGTRIGRNRTGFSTFGSPVHVQGWGDWSVATTGYGPLFNQGRLRTYTHTFSGTSSAAPIVAAAVIAIQSWHKANRNGQVLSPRAMRELLIRTGTPQGSGGHIGPLPNIRNAITALMNSGNNNGFFLMNTQAQLTQLGQPGDRAAILMRDLLLTHPGIEIVAQNGVWTSEIGLPLASIIERDRVISFATQADWSTRLFFNGGSVVFNRGDSARFVAEGSTWRRLQSS